ncbi:MAG: hypothetical protein U0172_01870 [Nitrospiraceae bacterium]
MSSPTIHPDETFQRAIHTLGQADPLIKLLQQVRLGRMKPSDAGLRVITEGWLATYCEVVMRPGLTAEHLRRLDPTPRVDVLIETGVLTADQAAWTALKTAFAQAVAQADGAASALSSAS